MVWIPITLGITISLMIAFWQRVVIWANYTLARWLGQIFGKELETVFLAVLSASDQSMVRIQRAAALIRDRLRSAKLTFQRKPGTREYTQRLQASIEAPAEEIVHVEESVSVAWYDLPDDVREKFIRRQSDEVAMQLEMNNPNRRPNE